MSEGLEAVAEPALEVSLLKALGVSLYGDRWLSKTAASIGMSKGHLHQIVNGRMTAGPAMRERIRAWTVEEGKRDVEAALRRVQMFRAAIEAFQ